MIFQSGIQVKHYTIDNLIARGGMGEVWKVWDETRNMAVAIKVVANDLIVDPEFKERMQDEAQRHKCLVHENIVTVLEVFETAGNTCTVMEFIKGTSLDLYLDAHASKHLEPDEAIRIVQEILRALDFAHRHGIIHRDVKPSNILLDENRRARLIDFGIALAVGEKRRTRTGKLIGTPLYMSPEQITKPKQINHLSDVYSVGCVLYEMLTGQPPFLKGQDGVGTTDFSIQEAHVKKPPLNPRLRVEAIPIGLDRLVIEALQKDPRNRIPGCHEFRRLLKNVDLHDPDEVAPDIDSDNGETEQFKWWGLVAALVLLLIIFIYLADY
jgi:serine/threonine-protein kinase